MGLLSKFPGLESPAPSAGPAARAAPAASSDEKMPFWIWLIVALMVIGVLLSGFAYAKNN